MFKVLAYNNLLIELKNVKVINKFKRKLKQLLLSTPLYSLNEFFWVTSLSF